MPGPVDIERPARQRRKPLDLGPAETGAAIPRMRAGEVTRPLEVELRRRGPSFEDIVRLDKGEIASLCFADRYRIGRRLGRGGMAVVFGGEHLDLGQPVAVKILMERSADRYQAMTQFLREARLCTRIRHENIVEVFDYGSTPEGLVYLVMELLEGEDLSALIARHPRGLPWARVRALMRQICAGLAGVHAAGIVHQDLKPSNCFRVLTRDGGERIKLIDFGVATAIRGTADGRRGEAHDVPLQRSGTIVGTPQYMSPEQARGAAVDARSDVYAAGIILCELLTGRVPFMGRSSVAVLSAQIEEPPPPLWALAAEGVCIEPAVQRLYERALAKDPAQRFATIAEMAAAIEAVGTEEAIEISGAFTPVPAVAAPTPAGGEADALHGRSWWELAAGFFAALRGVAPVARRTGTC